MKILIIGGTGVLSADILKKSIECGYNVSVLNRGHYNSQIPQNVTIYKANIRDIEEVKVKVGKEKFDVVIDFLSFNVKHLQTSLNILGTNVFNTSSYRLLVFFEEKRRMAFYWKAVLSLITNYLIVLKNTNVKYGCGTMLKKLIANIQLSVRISHMVIQEYHLV